MHGFILGNIAMTVFNVIGMVSGFSPPPLKFYIPAWIAVDTVLAFIVP